MNTPNVSPEIDVKALYASIQKKDLNAFKSSWSQFTKGMSEHDLMKAKINGVSVFKHFKELGRSSDIVKHVFNVQKDSDSFISLLRKHFVYQQLYKALSPLRYSKLKQTAESKIFGDDLGAWISTVFGSRNAANISNYRGTAPLVFAVVLKDLQAWKSLRLVEANPFLENNNGESPYSELLKQKDIQFVLSVLRYELSLKGESAVIQAIKKDYNLYRSNRNAFLKFFEIMHQNQQGQLDLFNKHLQESFLLFKKNGEDASFKKILNNSDNQVLLLYYVENDVGNVIASLIDQELKTLETKDLTSKEAIRLILKYWVSKNSLLGNILQLSIFYNSKNILAEISKKLQELVEKRAEHKITLKDCCAQLIDSKKLSAVLSSWIKTKEDLTKNMKRVLSLGVSLENLLKVLIPVKSLNKNFPEMIFSIDQGNQSIRVLDFLIPEMQKVYKEKQVNLKLKKLMSCFLRPEYLHKLLLDKSQLEKLLNVLSSVKVDWMHFEYVFLVKNSSTSKTLIDSIAGNDSQHFEQLILKLLAVFDSTFLHQKNLLSLPLGDTSHQDIQNILQYFAFNNKLKNIIDLIESNKILVQILKITDKSYGDTALNIIANSRSEGAENLWGVLQLLVQKKFTADQLTKVLTTKGNAKKIPLQKLIPEDKNQMLDKLSRQVHFSYNQMLSIRGENSKE